MEILMKFSVVSFNKLYFEERVAELCKKFKVDYELEWSDRHYLYKDDRNEPVYGYDVEVVIPDMDAFVDTGYTFLGSIENKVGAIMLVPSRYAVANGYSLSELKDEIKTFPCNECGRKIARTVIHVFKNNETDEISVYGSKCALTKFGVDFASYMHKFTKLYNTLEEEREKFVGIGYIPFYADMWCEYAFYNIVTYGYVSRSAAYEAMDETISTDEFTNDVYHIMTTEALTPYETSMKNELPAKLEETGYDHDDFLEWAENYIENLEESDFAFNLNSCFTVVKEGYVLDKLSGYLAYLVFKYWYEVKKAKDSAVEYNTDYSDLNVKDRLKDIPVTVVGEYTFNTRFGPCTIWTFRGVEDNRKYKWFTGVSFDKDADKIFLTGTIKKFEDDEKYGKAIVLTRCKVDYNE
jgi:hypothetical protein